MSIVNLLNNRLNEYAEFDLNTLYNISKNVRVFGGAVRDSISDREIHDIDILVEKRAINKCCEILSNNGYRNSEILTGKDISEMYKRISVINAPQTWLKGGKIIQLITPTLNPYNGYKYEDVYKSIMQGVDIRCCGVSFDGKTLYENTPKAVEDCEVGFLKVMSENFFEESTRTLSRVYKLEKRGWVTNPFDKSLNRNIKLKKLFSNKKFDYKTEYSKTNAHKKTIIDNNIPF